MCPTTTTYTEVPNLDLPNTFANVENYISFREKENNVYCFSFLHQWLLVLVE